MLSIKCIVTLYLLMFFCLTSDLLIFAFLDTVVPVDRNVNCVLQRLHHKVYHNYVVLTFLKQNTENFYKYWALKVIKVISLYKSNKMIFLFVFVFSWVMQWSRYFFGTNKKTLDSTLRRRKKFIDMILIFPKNWIFFCLFGPFP